MVGWFLSSAGSYPSTTARPHCGQSPGPRPASRAGTWIVKQRRTVMPGGLTNTVKQIVKVEPPPRGAALAVPPGKPSARPATTAIASRNLRIESPESGQVDEPSAAHESPENPTRMAALSRPGRPLACVPAAGAAVMPFLARTGTGGSGMPTDEDEFGQMLRFLRRKARLTQRGFGQLVGYSESQISRLEQGHRLPDPAAVAALFVPALRLTAQSAAGRGLVDLAKLTRRPESQADLLDQLAALLRRLDSGHLIALRDALISLVAGPHAGR